jgi:acyl-coenzyme A thioesterase PaaI-like protein
MGQRLRATARLVDVRDQRLFTTAGELRLADGRLAASATGLFAVPRPGTFGR